MTPRKKPMLGDVVGDEGQHAPGHRHRHPEESQGGDVEHRHDQAEDGRHQPVGAHRPGEVRERTGDPGLEDGQRLGPHLDAGHVEHQEDDRQRHDAQDGAEVRDLLEEPLATMTILLVSMAWETWPNRADWSTPKCVSSS